MGVRVFRNLVFLVLSLLAFAVPVRAQVTGGSILGIARDPSQAVLPNVQVTVTNLDTNLVRRTETDASGEYRVLALPVGRYQVEATQTGFQRFVATDIVLTINEQRRVDIAMEVGSLEQRVEVTANPVQVETTNTQLGQVIEERKILSLPLNGRSFVDLLSLQAGVAPLSGTTASSRAVSGQLSAGNISVNGQREQANSFLVNGGDVGEGRQFGTAIIPNLDSVAEFRLITNTFDAEYGRFSGAVMNAITKSGNNSFHGTAFEFLRNDQMDARGFFDPSRGALKRNQFGYAVGGPAIKNKVFWFTDYQGTREIRGISTGLVQVPTAAQRAGNLGASALTETVSGSYWAQILSQRLGTTVTNGQAYSSVFPNGVIPTRAFSPAAVATMKYIPLPNSGVNTFASAGQNRRINDDKAGQRVDIVNQRFGNWYGYYHFDDSTDANPNAGSSLGGFPATTPNRAQQGVLSHVKTFGPTAVNEARISFMRTAVRSNNPGDAPVSLSSLGFKTGANTLGIVNSGVGEEAVPRINLNTFNFGRANPALTQANNTWHFSESFSKIYKEHTFKFGVEGRYLQINGRNFYDPNGEFSFDGSETGSDLADYFLGAPSEYIQASLQVLDSRTKYLGAYGQDSWRIRPNLTFNYGLRWEFSMPWYDIYDRVETLVPGVQSTVFPTAPKGWLVPGDPGIPRTAAPTDYNNFGPRAGLAWSPDASSGLLGKVFGRGKTSIRASFGLYYTAIEDSTLFVIWGDAPYGLFWVSSAPSLFEEPFRTRADGSSQTQRFPFILPTPGDPSLKTLDWSVFLPISSSPGFWHENRLPYAEHYNFSLQRQLSSNMVLTLAYVGTQGHKLMSMVESNPGNPALCLSLRGSGVAPGTTQCGPNQENTIFTRPDGTKVFGTRSPFGFDFGQNEYEMATGNSNYNSLQVSLERRAREFTFLAAYTYGKSMDNSSNFSNRTNFSNYALSRSLSAFDSTHNFVVSYNYDIPFQRLFTKGPRRLVEGWSINGITRFAGGFPVSLSQSGDRSLVGASGIDVPNYVGGLVTQDPRSAGADGRTNTFFNKSAFATGPLGGFGNANRRFFHGPGFNNWDLGLHKNTQIRESMALLFRAEFFNAFNHAQFTNPQGNFNNSRFGQVSGTRDPRIGQLSLKFMW